MGSARETCCHGLSGRHTRNFQLHDFNLTADALSVNGVAWGYGPRRSILDQLLVQAAVEAGAEFRPHFSVRGLEMESGTVKGIEAEIERPAYKLPNTRVSR